MPLGLTIGQPPPNGVVIVGETTLVSGIATGTGGAEPVLVDSVTVQIGGGPPVTAGLSIGLARVFEAEVLVPGPPGPVVVTVTAHFDGGRVHDEIGHSHRDRRRAHRMLVLRRRDAFLSEPE